MEPEVLGEAHQVERHLELCGAIELESETQLQHAGDATRAVEVRLLFARTRAAVRRWPSFSRHERTHVNEGTWLRGRTAIAGIGHTPWGKRGEHAAKGHLRLVVEAITQACEEAGISPKEVDGYSSYVTNIDPAELFTAFGADQLRFATQTWGGGGGAMGGAFLNAALAVASGQANYVVVHKVMTMEGDNRYGQAFGQIGMKNPVVPGPMAFAIPYGLQAPGQMFALAARRHMHKYGTTDDQFAEVTINARLMAANDPEARASGCRARSRTITRAR